jgi:murein DD-endopeptidase MepM/ murein hydrolase activator NlpD
LPDPRRLYRRITESSLPTRVIAHLSVVSLLAVASLAGFAGTQGHDGAGPSSDRSFLSLVSSVRGAADPSDGTSSTTFDASALADEQTTLYGRGAPARLPGGEPLPTPAPLDPNATPLPGPTDGSVGSIGADGVPSTRAARPAASGALVWPVPNGSVSQYYHAGHLALDIAAPYGSSVVAAQGGTVSWAGWRNNGGGYVVSINHGNGMTTVYNHLGSIYVSVGQYVGPAQAIGGIGCTGICTGPHTHFEVVVNGVIDNPLRYY